MISQNFVENGDFEHRIENTSRVSDANPWYDPTFNSSDYLNANNIVSIYLVPKNIYGYQTAHSGFAYCYIFIGINWYHAREYIATTLKHPLIAGRKYSLKFYVSLADTSQWAIDALGAFFSVGKIDTAGQNGYLVNCVPQISNRTGNIIKDTTHWVIISGSFLAQGGEDNMTIGCFVRDENINYITVGTPTLMAGYYIDDVSVYECDNLELPAEAGNNRTICMGDSVQLGSTNYEYYHYVWHPKAGLSDSASGTPWAKPLVTTTYHLTQYNFGDTITRDSVTVFLNDCSAADAGENKAICKGDSVQLGSSNYTYNGYSWRPPGGIRDTTSGQAWAKPLITTTYYLTQYDTRDSISRDSVTISVTNCDTSTVNQMHIYPNPCNENLYVEFSLYVPDNSKIYITNTLGQTIIKEAILPEEKKKIINISRLAAGIYFCRVFTGEDMVRCEKVVVVK